MGTLKSTPFIEKLVMELGKENVYFNETQRSLHSSDESYHQPSLPDVVVYPQSKEDVRSIVKLAARFNEKIYPYGLGTSLEGHVIPYEKGVVIDFSQMNAILSIDPEDLLVTVQPGVTRDQLNQELKKFGLFFSVDPGANATVGGMTSTNASGTNSVKYGVMRDQVRDLEVVLADGTVIHTGNRAVKSSSGYDLTNLFVGAEGTLGCYTEMTLKVYGIPEKIVAGRVQFPSLHDAVSSVTAVLQAGIPIARIELIDEISMMKVNQHNETQFPLSPTLFLEFHGNPQSVQHDLAFCESIMNDYNSTEFHYAKDNAERSALWHARHNVAYAFSHSEPRKKLMVTDVCVPLSSLAEAIKHAQITAVEHHIEAGIVGHVGDGNFHALLLVDQQDSNELDNVAAYNEKIVRFALHVNGTCTGEHGVGVGKVKYLEEEHGDALDVMKSIKRALDPTNLFNPNKNIFI
ncbi:2-hydroxy-acid oxidase [Shouchella lehensis G1]|uniref:D-lactate dehydrogenase (cytochrome) n=2 Tax=Shouchella lehensis TaxID=300825 RepID=A0A060LWA6_9BACI|nr:2-hydroxy-acid oxidase [Shouchella lehensis G1]